MRKGVHLTSILIVLIYAFYGKQAAQILLISYLVLILFIEHIRLDRGIKIPFFNLMLRKKERSSIGSYVYFTLGALIAISVFSQNVAFAAVLMTTFGDMSAALVGKRFGRIRIFPNEKSVEGCIAEYFVNLVIAFVFISNLFISVSMAFVATYVETIFVRIDDNLAIPVIAGAFAELALFLTYL